MVGRADPDMPSTRSHPACCSWPPDAIPNGSVQLLIRPLFLSLAQSEEVSTPKKRGCPAISTRSELRHSDHLSMSFAFFQPAAHARMLNACFPHPSRGFLFSYIVDEPVLPSSGVTSITGIARTAIALPTLLDGQITRSGPVVINPC